MKKNDLITQSLIDDLREKIQKTPDLGIRQTHLNILEVMEACIGNSLDSLLNTLFDEWDEDEAMYGFSPKEFLIFDTMYLRD